MSFLKFIKGTAFGVVKGKRVPTDSLEESLNLLAKHKCEGLDICNGVLWLKDQTTGNKVSFSVNAGKLVVKNTEGNVLFEIDSE